jgi:hypothetical protein
MNPYLSFKKGERMNSPKRLARIAGFLYLLVGICGGFAEGFVDPKMYVAGNAAVATDSAYAAAFGAAGSNALVLLLLDIQHYGTFSAQVFFGLWLVPLGYLAYKSSGLFPKWLGVALIVGGVSYLVDLLAAFLVPDFSQTIHALVPIPTAFAEISMLLYLLVVGVKVPAAPPRNPAGAGGTRAVSAGKTSLCLHPRRFQPKRSPL